MKTFHWQALACGLAFAVTLAVIVGQRLSPEALAVVVGVIAGATASLPASLVVAWAATRAMARRVPLEAQARVAPAEPRVVVVAAPPAPAATQTLAGLAPFAFQAPPQATGLPPRQFIIIGGADAPESLAPASSLPLKRPAAAAAGGAPEEATWQR